MDASRPECEPLPLLRLLLFWTCEPVLQCRLSRGAFSSGKPQGVGISDWGGNGEGWKQEDQFTSNLGSGWTDPITARRVPSK